MRSNDFKIIFFGTSKFAAVILQYLLEANRQVVAVITRPDAQAGRSLKSSPSSVKKYCSEKYPLIPIYQPEKVSTDEFYQVLQNHSPDLFVVAAFGEIIKKNILSLPAQGSINVHPSLLPKYRGPSPLQSALMLGEIETGVCIIDVAEKMDSGVIFSKKILTIDDNDNFTSLQNKALQASKEIILQVIEQKVEGKAQGELQKDEEATYCKKIKPEDEKINWQASLPSIHNKIRALSDAPGAWTYIKIGEDVKRAKIYATELYKVNSDAPITFSKKEVCVRHENYVLKIKTLQLEGKKKLAASEFITGIRGPYEFI